MKSRNRRQQKTVFRLVEPDLQLHRCDDGLDPRLVELVRLLARRAAKQVLGKQMKGRRLPRS